MQNPFRQGWVRLGVVAVAAWAAYDCGHGYGLARGRLMAAPVAKTFPTTKAPGPSSVTSAQTPASEVDLSGGQAVHLPPDQETAQFALLLNEAAGDRPRAGTTEGNAFTDALEHKLLNLINGTAGANAAFLLARVQDMPASNERAFLNTTS